MFYSSVVEVIDRAKVVSLHLDHGGGLQIWVHGAQAMILLPAARCLGGELSLYYLHPVNKKSCACLKAISFAENCSSIIFLDSGGFREVKLEMNAVTCCMVGSRIAVPYLGCGNILQN
eukprot:Gb_01053 [translate_table: standard]